MNHGRMHPGASLPLMTIRMVTIVQIPFTTGVQAHCGGSGGGDLHLFRKYCKFAVNSE